MYKDINNKFNAKYILKSYLIALVWGGAILIPVYLADAQDLSAATFGVVLSAILFPFAKLFYDLIIGFKLEYRIKHSKMRYNPFVSRAVFFIYLLIFIFSIPLSPIGILYLLLKGIRNIIKK